MLLVALFGLMTCQAQVCTPGTNLVLRNVADVSSAIRGNRTNAVYDITAQVIQPGIPGKRQFFAADASGAEWFGVNPSARNECPTNAGDIIRITGAIVRVSDSDYGADSCHITVLSHDRPPVATPSTPDDLLNDANLNRFLRLEGTVHDAFRDEIDPSWQFITLNCNGKTAYVTIFSIGTTDDELDRLVGARVSVCGICASVRFGHRKKLGRTLTANRLDAVRILSPANADRFDVPSLESIRLARPADISSLDRHRTVGRVIAIWRNECLLLRTADGELVRVDLAHKTPPRYGDTIEAVGFPETDLYRINLSRAIWRLRAAVDGGSIPEAARPVSADELLSDNAGQPRIDITLHGQAIRIQGIVRSIPATPDDSGRFYLECGHSIVPIDFSASPAALNGVSPGCTLDVAGTCIIETEKWHENGVFPRVKEVLLAIRQNGDIRILSRPPWWTVGRLLSVIGTLAIGLVLILVWNFALRRRAERRGRELAAEQLAHVTSELKVNERTRLAVELHDALSQTLTGVSMQIDTAAGFAEGKIPTISKCLAIASRTIDACRMELRNTLWDLRSAALDEPSMDAAIRKTLCQNLAGIDLSVRFNVPRETFSDNTAHAILKIIRELATNALRHGKATSLRIAGTIDDGKLLFSVRDNGCGFDPDLAPGISQGHFGLQGIAERLERLNGEMRIESTTGKGAKVTVVLPIPAWSGPCGA